jgi:hypothetical protein
MRKITELASGQINSTEAITVILAEPDDIPASVVIHWPLKPTLVDPRAFSVAADVAVKTLAAAVVRPAQLRRGW